MADNELFGNSEQLDDTISRKAAIEILAFGEKYFRHLVDDIHVDGYEREKCEWGIYLIETYIAGMKDLPSAQPEQRYTEEELRVFAHGISLSLLSKRSAQHWRYDEDTATEIKFLERLYDKVVADMGDEQDG